MLRVFRYILILLLIPTLSYAAVNQIEEVDGVPSKFPWKIKFDNGSLTDNGDGTMTHSIAGFGDTRYLTLDQSTPQTVVDGVPIFESGVALGDSTKYIKKIDANTVGLYVNSVLVQDWQIVPAGGGAGVAMGVLGLTYSS